MKWSALASLFAAPLVLAGALQADVVARTDSKDSKDMSYGESYGSGSSTIIVEEVVLIWVCMGGGSSTTVMNSVTNTMGSTMSTHTVSSLSSPYASILR